MLLVVLQNTYELLTNTPEWETALWASHTGKRLREMLPDGMEFTVTNASKVIGSGVCSECPADTAHLTTIIEQVGPTRILACGKVAQAGLTELGVEFVAAPHPAWRLLSKDRTAAIRDGLRIC